MLLADTDLAARLNDRSRPRGEDISTCTFLRAFNLQNLVHMHAIPANTYSSYQRDTLTRWPAKLTPNKTCTSRHAHTEAPWGPWKDASPKLHHSKHSWHVGVVGEWVWQNAWAKDRFMRAQRTYEAQHHARRGSAPRYSPRANGPTTATAPTSCAPHRCLWTRWACPCGSRAAVAAPHPYSYRASPAMREKFGGTITQHCHKAPTGVTQVDAAPGGTRHMVP